MPSKHATLVTLRAKIAELQAKLEALPSLPLPAEDALARLDAWIASEADRFNLAGAARTFATPGALLGRVLEIQGLGAAQGAVQTNAAPMLCALFGTEIRARLAAAIQAQTTNPGPSLAKRPAHEAALRGELETLELQEEQIIRDSEADGERLARRPDATPSIVLAP